MTEAEMMRRMSAREYNGWVAQYEIAPFGPEAEEMRLARLMAMLAEMNRDKDKRKDPFTPDEFMLESMRPLDPSAELGEQDVSDEERERALAEKVANVFGLKIPGG